MRLLEQHFHVSLEFSLPLREYLVTRCEKFFRNQYLAVQIRSDVKIESSAAVHIPLEMLWQFHPHGENAVWEDPLAPGQPVSALLSA